MNALSALLISSNLVPVAAILAVSLLCARYMVPAHDIPNHHQFAALDGLRGFLAVGVFIHHSIFWSTYISTGAWTFPLGRLYWNIGHNSVNLFFMVTGFLFSMKLLDVPQKQIDWLTLYVSRFLRLTPLYWCACILIFTLVAINSRFTGYDTVENIAFQVCDWLLFTIPGHPDINGHPDTYLMIAGVIWTLPYEWYFYLLLPALALLFGQKINTSFVPYLLVAALVLTSFSAWHFEYVHFFNFIGGFIAALVARNSSAKSVLSKRGANFVLLLCILVSYTSLDTQSFSNILVQTLLMCLIACGADLFGILTCRASRALSTISYGVYLLHGVLLYVAMIYVVPGHVRFSLEHGRFWMIAICSTPALILAATLSWHFIEFPALSKTRSLTDWLRKNRTKASGEQSAHISEEAR